MSTEDITPAGAAASSCPLPSKRTLAPLDRDSIYFSKERWRIIPQRLGPMSIQYLVIDAHHNEIVGTHAKMSDSADIVFCVEAYLRHKKLPNGRHMTVCPVRGALTVAISKFEGLVGDISTFLDLNHKRGKRAVEMAHV